ncbi:hypothetical protein ACFO1B_35850 [Dactylosporangium siamense]|uniref:Uncharacterized protein n=1 Tax=Dactylosporangium siamense TaxID=685454 RepID=A0A919PP51_9ACTN|nr:hypothetical protein [Dactylosporangium siamense]GIG45950.1 hypothetical protein Dsi01nite_039910 [Dactylosporangium siamense]
MTDRDTAFAEYLAARSGTIRGTAFLLCTVVFLAQAKADERPDGGARSLAALPLPEDRLAALATDERFHIKAS